MSLILNIETSTKSCSVAASKEGELISLKEVSGEKYQHNEFLYSFINEALDEAKIKMKDLNAVAISEGPGSYTGLRIGTSTAKGICHGLNIPLIAVSTLESLANLVDVSTDFICPMLDARRMEVYSAIFDNNLNLLEETEAIEVDKDFRADYLEKGKVTFIGDGVRKCSETIIHNNANLILDREASAKGMISLSYKKFSNQDFADLAYFEPYYLKDFVAGTPKKIF
ncbi:MAG: tRNA (adenosine(37)-N6)-threonylcarbamoyltransferase complex dimerization subunit type 1 TsaB [Crocinitomicaceae bacterium]|nr:tRNA (adenosine(37)-N6)-threonylcarbamoyltransferase complex dimerization subunit type 1 TsaB [Crocinitomicaceae bacterium]